MLRRRWRARPPTIPNRRCARACPSRVTQRAGGPATPLAFDLATFHAQPAAVVLLPGIGGPGRVDVWVVPPDCAQGKGQFLYYANVARP